MLRAGLTEVLVTGIEIRWIRVRHRPIGMPAKPTAAPFDVEPMMTNRKKKVSRTSVSDARAQAVFAGAEIAVAVGGEAVQLEAGLARGDHVEHRRRQDGADHLRDDVGHDIGGLELSGGPEPDRDRRIEVAARDVADGIGHREHGQAEGEGDPEEADAERRKGGGQHRAAAAAEGKPEGAEELGSGAA